MIATELSAELHDLVSLPERERVSKITEFGRRLLNDDQVNGAGANVRPPVVAAMVELLSQGAGNRRERLLMGEVLGQLGDSRLRAPEDADYWVSVPLEATHVHMGRYPVTNQEFRSFTSENGYSERQWWTDEGWAWLQACEDPWPTRATHESSAPFVVANQPVVGITWFEASAYAKRHAARLPRVDERVWVVRGAERRPYPWGSPFGEGNANTREEVLDRPCAVGLYVGDRTPEGVCDLAGNTAEWTADGVSDERLIHPGAWDQPSLAAWAKALTMEAPRARWAGLGFRLVRD